MIAFNKFLRLKNSLKLSQSGRLLSSFRKLRFVQYTKNDEKLHLGLSSEDGSEIAEIPSYCCPNDMRRFIANDNVDLDDLRRKADSFDIVKISDVTLLPPILNPQKIICIGLNYKSHCDEQKIQYPHEPVFFCKFPSSLCGPTDSIKAHKITTKMDWEVELAVIIGTKAFQVHREEALHHVFGYTIAQDITAREWQKKNGCQWSLSKSFDTFCPLGPCIVHKSDINAKNLTIKCSVNDVVKQCGKTNELIFSIEEIISRLSSSVTLVPGDVILTGTCSGVGVFRNPREFLKVGDVVESEIEGIGKLINTVADC